MAELVVDTKEQDEDVPESPSERSYSGKFNLWPGEKHRKVALHAAEENLSINRGWCASFMVDG